MGRTAKRPRASPTTETHEPGCALHGIVACQSCQDTFGQVKPEESDEGWLAHELIFEKVAGERDLRYDPDELLVIDPRAKEKELLQSKRKK